MVAPEEKWLQDTGKPCGFPPAAWGQEFKWDTPHPTRGVQSAFVSWLLTLLRVCQPYPCSFSFSLCFPSEQTGLVRGTHGEGLVSTALTQAAGTPANSSKAVASRKQPTWLSHTQCGAHLADLGACQVGFPGKLASSRICSVPLFQVSAF